MTLQAQALAARYAAERAAVELGRAKDELDVLRTISDDSEYSQNIQSAQHWLRQASLRAEIVAQAAEAKAAQA